MHQNVKQLSNNTQNLNVVITQNKNVEMDVSGNMQKDIIDNKCIWRKLEATSIGDEV